MKKAKYLRRRLERVTPRWMRPLPYFDEMSEAQSDEWGRSATGQELHAVILGCQPWEVTRELTTEELEALVEAYQKQVESEEGSDDIPVGKDI
jgi:hypothetical protein